MSGTIRHISDLDELNIDRPTYVAIGVFDGVHKGHQQLLRNMVESAESTGAKPVALTFHPHPSQVIGSGQGPMYLCTVEERGRLLMEQGIDLVVVHPFDQAVRHTRAAEFIDKLCRSATMKELWGGTFGLGYRREGDLPFLQALGRDKGFSVHPYKAMVHYNGQPISSSRVRKALSAGDLEQVQGCLGRPYRVSGTVIRGDGRGRVLGIPTANLRVWQEQLLPANGVYAALATYRGGRFLAAANIGHRPTVNGSSINVEAHLLDFDQDIYDQELTLDFIERLRNEQKFPDLDALVTQIRADIDQTRFLLSSRP